MNEYPQESFVFYRSFREAIAVMTPEDQLAAFLAICDYALYGVEPKLSGMPLVAFIVAKPSIDANASKREGGKKGGRPKKETYGFENENHRFPKAESTETGTDTISEKNGRQNQRRCGILKQGDKNEEIYHN